MRLIDFLTSGIGYTKARLKAEREKQGYRIKSEDHGEIRFTQKFAALEYTLEITNYLGDDARVKGCRVVYSDDDQKRLDDDFLDAIQYYEKETYREFIDPDSGKTIEIMGYFLLNGEYFYDYDFGIHKIPERYVTPIDFLRRRK